MKQRFGIARALLASSSTNRPPASIQPSATAPSIFSRPLDAK
jgi:hypothetical protein